MKLKYPILLFLAIAIGTSIVYLQNQYQISESDTNHTYTDDSIIIAVTYEKLAPNAMTWPHPIPEENVIRLVNYTQNEINQYCTNNQIETRFRFIPTQVIHKGGSPPGENPPGLDEMIQLNTSGINLIVGHDYSLANRYSFEYAKENNMLLLSPTGLTIGQAEITDNLYQLKPNHYETYSSDKAFAQIIKELGYKAFITINTGEHSPYINRVYETARALNYSYRNTLVELDIDSYDYALYLRTAEEFLIDLIDQYGKEKVCVLVEPLWEDYSLFFDEADYYPLLSEVNWFDIAGISEEQAYEMGYASRLAKYGFIQIVDSSAKSIKADLFWSKYTENVGNIPTPSRRYREAARYDAMWIMALSVLEANSSETEEVMNMMPAVCQNYWGVIGNCSLDANGDRIANDYEVYKWGTVEDEAQFVEIGFYKSYSTDDSHYIIQDSDFVLYEDPLNDVSYYWSLYRVSEQDKVFRSINYTLIYDVNWQQNEKSPPLYTARRAFYFPNYYVLINVTSNHEFVNGIYLPLVIQDLDASMIEGVNEFNRSIWISPIVWSENVTESSVYRYSIPSEGWYVVSLCGPVWYYSGTGSLGSRQGGYQTGSWGDPDNWLTMDDLVVEARITVLDSSEREYEFAYADETNIK